MGLLVGSLSIAGEHLGILRQMIGSSEVSREEQIAGFLEVANVL